MRPKELMVEGKPPVRKLKGLEYDLPETFALFPPLILDRVRADWALKGGNDLLAHYTEHGLSAYPSS
jgi:hypothetical protein